MVQTLIRWEVRRSEAKDEVAQVDLEGTGQIEWQGCLIEDF